MLDIQTISVMIASAGVFAAAIYYILQIRNQNRMRQTDLVMRLYLTYCSKEFQEALTRHVAMTTRTMMTLLRSMVQSLP